MTDNSGFHLDGVNNGKAHGIKTGGTEVAANSYSDIQKKCKHS
jgi:hypothetical protein